MASFSKIEKKWEKLWQKAGVFEPALERGRGSPRKAGRPPFYNLMMFPYPSAEGLHIGSVRTFTGIDIYGRFKRMQGYDVFEPIGLDGFGIHSENYALKLKKHPAKLAKITEKNFYRQLEMIGNGFAWKEKLETYDPEYYKWTQWIFVQMFKKGLAYRKKAFVNWCPDCRTVLADEQVISGECERCSTKVIKKELEQWFFRITNYAERLLKDLEKIDWSEKIKIAQRNWIGRSEGALIRFPIFDSQLSKADFLFLHGYGWTSGGVFWPWLKKEIEDRGGRVYTPDLPHTNEPDVEEQAEFVSKNYRFTPNTVIVTHSLGGLVAMKLIPRLQIKIKTLIMAAPFLKPEFVGEPRPKLEKACDYKFDFNVIRRNVEHIVVLRDKNDHIIPVAQPKEVAEKLKADFIDTTANTTHFDGVEEPAILDAIFPKIEVFTTRPDTLFGATYMVLSPEHELISKIKNKISNIKEVETYVKKARAKTEEERIKEGRDKTGVELKGIKAINPANKKEIPIWVADYVLGNVGTGAIMAVPAHDERDFEFAKKFSLSIREVIVPNVMDRRNPPVEGKKVVQRQNIHAIVKDKKTGKYLGLKWRKFNWTTFPMGGVKDGEDVVEAAKREVREETGFVNLKFVKVLDGQVRAEYFAAHKDENRVAWTTAVIFDLIDHRQENVSAKEKEAHEIVWLDKSKLNYENMTHAEVDIWNEKLNSGSAAYTGHGILTNSGKFNGMDSEKAKWEIAKFVGGARKVQYRLRDWLISRQRYWGPPIPMIFCPACAEASAGKENAGWQAVPEKDLPVKLPYLKDWRPKGTGVSPLASESKFYKVKCPKCKGEARRETDVSDTFLDSSWYFFRYLDPKNKKAPFDKLRARRWLPVDMYIGGAEHAVLHLLYVRFITKVFCDLGFIDFSAKGGSASGGDEPFKKFRAHGLITKDGAKMSKSRGNIVNPDIYIKKFGADAIRMYLAFMAPLEQGGDFREEGISGITRFLNRIWKIQERIEKPLKWDSENMSKPATQLWHKSIKKIGEDIEALKFNTAISKLMILVNEMETGVVNKEKYEIFLRLLAPFAPFLSEELFQKLRTKNYKLKTDSIHLQPWPKYDEKKIKEEIFSLVVQINGRVRATVQASMGISQREAERLAKSNENVKKFLVGTPKKVVFVPNKLINFVI